LDYDAQSIHESIRNLGKYQSLMSIRAAIRRKITELQAERTGTQKVLRSA
jgi:hypothetical protein